jgi:sugar lactone lactonase YvrE
MENEGQERAMPEIELVLDCRAIIGESPTWFAPEQALYWIDVKAPTLHRLSADGSQAQWRLEADIGAFALLEGAKGALVALRNGIFRLDFASGETGLLAPPPFDPDLFRFNEGVCDAEGRFWVGDVRSPSRRYGRAKRRASASIQLRRGARRRR